MRPTLFVSLALACATNLAFGRTFVAHPFYLFDMQDNFTASSTLIDLDNDGDLDVLVANGRHWAQPNYAYLNNGSGRLTRRLSLGNEAIASYRILSMENGSNSHDLLVINDQAPHQYLIGTPTGGYVATEFSIDVPTGNARDGITLDLNLDGHLDIVIARRNQTDLLLLGGKATPLLCTTSLTATRPRPQAWPKQI